MANGQSVEQNRRDCIAKIGENIQVRRGVRLASSSGVLGSYLHGVRIGVVVELDGGDDELAKDIAMHIAASNPLCVSADQVPAELLAKEKEIFAAQALAERQAGQHHRQDDRGSGAQVSGGGDPARSALRQGSRADRREAAEAGGAKVVRFARIEVGEGIEKKSENFADEVVAVRGD